jgi:hypothetical protein
MWSCALRGAVELTGDAAGPTVPAPTTVFWPIVTPGPTIALPPIQTFSPIVTGAAYPSPVLSVPRNDTRQQCRPPLREEACKLGPRPADEAAAAAIAFVLGETTEPTTPDEIAWAFRKTLENCVS